MLARHPMRQVHRGLDLRGGRKWAEHVVAEPKESAPTQPFHCYLSSNSAGMDGSTASCCLVPLGGSCSSIVALRQTEEHPTALGLGLLRFRQQRQRETFKRAQLYRRQIFKRFLLVHDTKW